MTVAFGLTLARAAHARRTEQSRQAAGTRGRKRHRSLMPDLGGLPRDVSRSAWPVQAWLSETAAEGNGEPRRRLIPAAPADLQVFIPSLDQSAPSSTHGSGARSAGSAKSLSRSVQHSPSSFIDPSRCMSRLRLALKPKVRTNGRLRHLRWPKRTASRLLANPPTLPARRNRLYSISAGHLDIGRVEAFSMIYQPLRG